MRRTLVFFLILYSTAIAAQAPIHLLSSEILGANRTRSESIDKYVQLVWKKKSQKQSLGKTIAEIEDYLNREISISSARLNIAKLTDDSLSFQIELRELPAYYPIPFVELADRNFNEWWNQFNHDFSRINAGLALQFTQLSGRLDPLYLEFQLGFTDEIKLRYELAFFDESQHLGFFTELTYSSSRQFASDTKEDKRVFTTLGDLAKIKNVEATLGLQYQQSPYVKHRFALSFDDTRIREDIENIVNPDFFYRGDSKHRFMGLEYSVDLDTRDLRAYARKGKQLRWAVAQKGLGFSKNVSLLTTELKFSVANKFSEKWFYQLESKARWAINNKYRNHYNNRALGYDRDVLRGYQNYVIDGEDFFYAKASLRYTLYDSTLDLGKLMPLKFLRKMPLLIAIGPQLDYAYVNSEFNTEFNNLQGKSLWGQGIGIDIVDYKNFVFTLDFSRNIMNEHGFYIGSPRDQ